MWHVWFGPPARPIEALPIAGLALLALVRVWRAVPRMSPPERAAVLIPVTCYPLVYYLVGYVPRYTFPLSVLLFMLAGFAISMQLGVLDRPAVWRVGRGRVGKRPGPQRPTRNPGRGARS